MILPSLANLPMNLCLKSNGEKSGDSRVRVQVPRLNGTGRPAPTRIPRDPVENLETMRRRAIRR